MKTRLFGFELLDLLVVFLYLAISNLIFGNTPLKLPFVWIGTCVLAVALFFAKKGKPESHVQHTAEYQRMPSILTAAKADTEYMPFPKFND